MSEYTPGPWKRSEMGRGNDICSVKTFRTGAIATAFLRADSREQEANARLIATAPELLAACQYLCAEVRNGCNRKDEAFMWGVAKAEAIIAKAGGGES